MFLKEVRNKGPLLSTFGSKRSVHILESCNPFKNPGNMPDFNYKFCESILENKTKQKTIAFHLHCLSTWTGLKETYKMLKRMENGSYYINDLVTQGYQSSIVDRFLFFSEPDIALLLDWLHMKYQ